MSINSIHNCKDVLGLLIAQTGMSQGWSNKDKDKD